MTETMNIVGFGMEGVRLRSETTVSVDSSGKRGDLTRNRQKMMTQEHKHDRQRVSQQMLSTQDRKRVACREPTKNVDTEA